MSTASAELFPILEAGRVPANSRPLLDRVKKSFGFVPNLFAVFSNSPALLEGYLALNAAYEKASLTPVERQLVLLTASVANHCDYCTAAHSTVLKGMLDVPADIVAAVRANRPLPNRRHAALVNLTRAIVNTRGEVPEQTLKAYFDAGYRPDRAPRFWSA
jgi:AhpD family alkylhydroperoxidase